MKRLLIIGAGMATAKLLQELSALEHEFEIEVIGEESFPSYNRILLSSILAQEKSSADINLIEDSWYAHNRVALHLDEKVIAIDTAEQTLQTSKNRTSAYDLLILATGSVPFIPPTPGMDADNVLGFRNQRDLERIKQLAAVSKKAVVIGGGLLGLEAARGLRNLDVDVTVVNREQWIMPRQLDATAATLLQKIMNKQGIQFRLDTTAQEMRVEENEVEAVTLASGEVLDADMVLVTAGIVPNRELAEAAGIPCNRGILVDHQLRTQHENIFALGECCELDAQLFGLVAPVYEQAKVLANFLAGNGDSSYEHKDCLTRLKIAGVNVVSGGQLPFAESCQSQILFDEDSGVYRRLVFEGSALVGFVLIGDSDNYAWYEKLMSERDSVSAIRSTLMFGRQDAENVSRDQPRCR